jgi:hypothetical protein
MTISRSALTLPLALALAALGWLATLAAISLASDDAPALIVPFPSASLLGKLPAGAAIVRLDDWSVTLASNETGFARALYAAGAMLVLPSGLQGCSN